MAKTDEEILNSYKARIKRQNRAIKDNYDKVTATLPKGTIDRIRALGLSINAAINKSLLAYLDYLEKSPGEIIQDTFPGSQNASKSIASESEKELSATKTEEFEIKANKASQASAGVEKVTIAELQELIDKRKAERKQRESENSSSVNKILGGILDGSVPEEEPAKETSRQEDITKADCSF